jgi:hypothetical protein
VDRYGEWNDDPNYGRVWMPSYAYGGYDPFRYGSWQRVGFGWSWIDSVPWGFYTFHSGRWAYLHHRNRWCWVPERDHHTRQVAQDTRPFGRPRADARSRDDRRDAPTAVPVRRDGDERRRVATTTELPQRIAAERTRAAERHNDDAPVATGRIPQPGTVAAGQFAKIVDCSAAGSLTILMVRVEPGA